MSDRAPRFTKEQREYLARVLTPPCCHVSGMHDPTHFKENPKRLCDIQKSTAFENAIKRLRLKVVATSADGCYWCERHEKETRGKR
jgi:hypothetical protein